MEELQSRIIVAENLPEDYCHRNLMEIFSAAGTPGSVKAIRTCKPQTSNSDSSSASRSAKADGMHFSNKQAVVEYESPEVAEKAQAVVEYESPEVAEKAVAKLNDEGSWRSGVQLMLKRMDQVRGKKGQDGEVQIEEHDASTKEQIHHAHSHEQRIPASNAGPSTRQEGYMTVLQSSRVIPVPQCTLAQYKKKYSPFIIVDDKFKNMGLIRTDQKIVFHKRYT